MRFNHALLLLPLLAACVTPADQYPSLALRDAERATGAFEPAEPEPYAPPVTPVEVTDRLARLTADAASAHEAFLAATAPTRAAVAAAGEAGGDTWARAQVALAGLGAARSQAMIALADLDRLYVDAAIEGAATDRIGAARDTVAGQVIQQDATMAALAGSLR